MSQSRLGSALPLLSPQTQLTSKCSLDFSLLGWGSHEIGPLHLTPHPAVFPQALGQLFAVAHPREVKVGNSSHVSSTAVRPALPIHVHYLTRSPVQSHKTSVQS